jgi:hypothetical protein
VHWSAESDQGRALLFFGAGGPVPHLALKFEPEAPITGGVETSPILTLDGVRLPRTRLDGSRW